MGNSIGLLRSWHKGIAGQGLGEAGAAERGVDKSDYDFPTVITDMPINAAQRTAAVGVMVVLFAIAVAAAPFANLPKAHFDAFIPVLQSVACLVDLITAALLFSQYSIRALPATLVIATGYIFSGLFAFAQTLAFPGAYAPAGLIGDGRNTAAWLFVLWHTAFPLAVLIYALSKDRAVSASRPRKSPALTIIVTIMGTVLAAAVLTYLASILSVVMPALYEGATRQTRWANAANIYLWLLNNAALAALFFRRRTILDLWLMVTLFAWWPNFLTAAFFTVVRYSIGWYISRCFAVVASSTLLMVLLAETTVLYARLASSILLLRRERTERLTTVEAATAALAHEVRQPLAGITSLGAAGLRWLDRTPVEVDKAKSCLTSILGAAQRADEIITSVRELFKKTPSHRALVQLNDLSRLVMQLARHDLLSSGTTVASDYQEDLPLIYADHIQLQQVLLNLVKNSIDAMIGRPFGERRLLVATGSAGHSAISFYIRDSGPGIAAEDRDRIFHPFFTTKSNGMGLGLSICRTIVEEHGGTLRLTKSGPAGSSFEIVLPIASPQQQADEKQTTAATGEGATPPVVAG
jgi:signal transduction histidine kinase